MSAKTKKEMNLMPNDLFFSKIAEKCNYIDKDLVKMVYYEMVRLTSQELRHNGAIRYPDLGDFYIKYHKERLSRSIVSGQIIKIPAIKTVKFAVNSKIKKYFASLS